MISFISTLVSHLSTRFGGENEEGQTLVEYGLLLALIAIVVIAVLIVLGPAISGIFRSVNNQL
ncbi:MAG: Flp family type IVb pilin [Chloroflexota bacterium]|nr:Flp family type IVb pilin [Chloroflexota bacterium]